MHKNAHSQTTVLVLQHASLLITRLVTDHAAATSPWAYASLTPSK